MRKSAKHDKQSKDKLINHNEIDPTEDDFDEMEEHLNRMEDHLFNAGVSILQAAKTQEKIFHASVEAIQEALEPGSSETDSLAKDAKVLLPEQQADAGKQEITLATVWNQLNVLEAGQKRLEEQLEYLIQTLIPKSTDLAKTTDLVAAQEAFEQPIQVISKPARSQWNEKTLKKRYKTLANVRADLKIEARTWKLAVTEANALTNASTTV